MRFVVALLFGLVSLSPVIGQDTLVLLDRAPIAASNVVIQEENIFYVPAGKTRQREIERTKVFSVKYSGGKEQVVYVQDTLENNWYTATQMAMYIKGQEDARSAYKTRASRAGKTGFLVGFAGSASGLLYGPLFVLGYTSLKGYSKPAFEEQYGFSSQYADDPYYREGFGTMAKRYTVRRSAAGSAVGYILGVITLSLVLS